MTIQSLPTKAVSEVRDVYVRNGHDLVNFSGASSAGTSIYFEDFLWRDVTNTMGKAVAGSGAVAATDINGGAHELRSGATGSSSATIYGTYCELYLSATPAWYMATRFAIITAVDAETTASVGLYSNRSVMAGYIKGLNANNFHVQHSSLYGGSAIDLGVPLDTSNHVYEMWCNSGSNVLSCRIDNGPTLSATQTPPSAQSTPIVFCANGSTAAARALRVDWWMLITQRA